VCRPRFQRQDRTRLDVVWMMMMLLLLLPLPRSALPATFIDDDC
jgi:hypothetical protein